MALPSQGMMLSERPSGSLGRGSPLAGEGSIGNYKGVMLCNRPFAGTAAASKGGGGDGATASGKHVFVTGKVKSEVGFAGKNLQNEKLLRKRVKQETALTRHRRWLADLQLTKQALEEKYMEDLQRKDENKKRFAKREAQMRQMTRELAQGNNDAKHCGHDGDSDESIAAPIHDGSVRDHQERGSQAWAIGLDQDSDDLAGKRAKNRCEHRQSGESKQDDDADGRREDGVESPADSIELRAVEKRRKRDGKPCRPMWAMTETKAVAETERKHEEELEELLEFTQGLDFGKYIRDVEVQTMIDQVKRRIAEIEAQPEVDEGVIDDEEGGEGNGRGRRPNDDAEARLEARVMRLTDKNLREIAAVNGDNAGAVSGCSNQQGDDNMSIARTAMSEGGRSVRSVHSTRSLTAVVEGTREKIAANCVTGDHGSVATQASSGTKGEGPVSNIVVTTHQEDGGLRRGGKNTVSNLPYIRRNPAV